MNTINLENIVIYFICSAMNNPEMIPNPDDAWLPGDLDRNDQIDTSKHCEKSRTQKTSNGNKRRRGRAVVAKRYLGADNSDSDVLLNTLKYRSVAIIKPVRGKGRALGERHLPNSNLLNVNVKRGIVNTSFSGRIRTKTMRRSSLLRSPGVEDYIRQK